MNVGLIRCPKCSKGIESDSNFCINCGISVKNYPIRSKFSSKTILEERYSANLVSKQIQNPIQIKIQIIGFTELFVGLGFFLGGIIGIWIFYFMEFAIEYSKSLENIPGETLNFLERFIQNIDILIFLAICYGFICLVFSYGLLKNKEWGRIGTLLVLAISMILIPIGSIAGIIGIYYLSRPEIAKFITKQN